MGDDGAPCTPRLLVPPHYLAGEIAARSPECALEYALVYARTRHVRGVLQWARIWLKRVLALVKLL